MGKLSAKYQFNSARYTQRIIQTVKSRMSIVSEKVHRLDPLSVGFLPGRKVFLPHEGEKQGRKYFCHSFCHFCRGERAELIKT